MAANNRPMLLSSLAARCFVVVLLTGFTGYRSNRGMIEVAIERLRTKPGWGLYSYLRATIGSTRIARRAGP